MRPHKVDKPATRAEAVATGVIRFFTGKPCKRGHISERYIWGGCIECVKIMQAAWAAKNTDKLLEYQRHYRDRLDGRKAEVDRKRRQANAQRFKDYDHNRYLADPLRYKDARRAGSRRWEKRNPHLVLAKTRRRAAAKLNRTPAWANHDSIGFVYRAASIAKVTWPEFDVEVDHDLPLRGLTVSGLHVHNNLRLMRGTANVQKGNRV